MLTLVEVLQLAACTGGLDAAQLRMLKAQVTTPKAQNLGPRPSCQPTKEFETEVSGHTARAPHRVGIESTILLPFADRHKEFLVCLALPRPPPQPTPTHPNPTTNPSLRFLPFSLIFLNHTHWQTPQPPPASYSTPCLFPCLSFLSSHSPLPFLILLSHSPSHPIASFYRITTVGGGCAKPRGLSRERGLEGLSDKGRRVDVGCDGRSHGGTRMERWTKGEMNGEGGTRRNEEWREGGREVHEFTPCRLSATYSISSLIKPE
jgi:hypothetical protein